jgi:hypothetical protein
MISEYVIKLKEKRVAYACDYWVACGNEHKLPAGILYDQPTNVEVQILEVSHGVIPDPPPPN